MQPPNAVLLFRKRKVRKALNADRDLFRIEMKVCFRFSVKLYTIPFLVLVHTRIDLYPQRPQYPPSSTALTNRRPAWGLLFYCTSHWLGNKSKDFFAFVHSDRPVHPHKLKSNQIIGLSTHPPGYRTFRSANGSFIIHVNCLRPPSGSPSTPSSLHKLTFLWTPSALTALWL